MQSIQATLLMFCCMSCALSHVLQAINWDKRVEDAAKYLTDVRCSDLVAEGAFGPMIR